MHMIKPDYLKPGDRIALISPAYHTPEENVVKTAGVLRSWGFEPVTGRNIGKDFAGKYAGTPEERLSDLLRALGDPSIKAVICNRGGYGTIHLADAVPPETWRNNAKWLVGFSDITTLHFMANTAGVMSLHGTMSSFLAAGGTDATSILMRDLLLGKVPAYELPAHQLNQAGKATGRLVGGNLMSFAPLVGSSADATALVSSNADAIRERGSNSDAIPERGSSADATASDGIILFIEEVEESMHNIDRQLNMLRLHGVLDRCRGVILGEFTDCDADLGYGSVEELISGYLRRYDIPVIYGFPAGHGKENLPLVMGAPATMEVRTEGASLGFGIEGETVRRAVGTKV